MDDGKSAIEDGEHFYVSTACLHDRHDDCRLICKWCDAPCNCRCHREETAD